ncbi:MAG: hypothetical protein MAG795_01244 [Candidatus Woesearchaeota archaeon]|nr:hypothetical protein [Candidatus Woesearchaeota archaeon]
MAKKKIKKIAKSVDQVDDKVKEEIISQYVRKLDKITKTAKREAKEFQSDVKKRTSTAIAAAFSFVIALFWRDAITDIINKILKDLGLVGSTYIAKIIAAITVTFIGVIAINKISRWGERKKKKNKIND